MESVFEAFISNPALYSAGHLVGETLHFPTNTEEVQSLLKRIGVDGVRCQEYFIIGDTSIDISSVMVGIEDRLMEMELGPLFGLWFQSLFVGITMWALTICIFIITFGRMIEIYLVTSVAPIPMATMMGKEWGGMGQNYIRSLLALGFQAFLIIVCVAIYAVLVQNIALVDDIIYAIWTCMGYTVLLCFCLFKTSSLAKSVFNAH
ncbi:MAG: VirB6/TrbL-like conjugal transfer protein, CD1112 family [Oscillibacter sp.]